MNQESFVDKLNQRKIKQIDKIFETSAYETSHSIDEESQEKFIQVLLKSENNEFFLKQIEKAARTSYCSLMPIILFNLTEDNENHIVYYSIYYKDFGSKTLSQILELKENLNDPLQRFFIADGLISLLLYFQAENINLGPLTKNDIFIIDKKPKIINYGFNFSDENPYLSVAKIIKLSCIDPLKEITKGKSNLNYSELNFYEDLFNILSNSSLSKPPKIQNVLKGILSADLSSLGIDSFSNEINEYHSQTLTSSLKSKFLIGISKKTNECKEDLSEISSTIESISERIHKIKSALLNVQENKNEDRIEKISQNIHSISAKIDEGISSLNSRANYTDFNVDLRGPIQNLNETQSTYISLNPHSSGVFSYLINSQETVFDRFVIPSQSSGDVYSIIDASSPQNYSSGSGEYEWIQFEFPDEIEFTSFKIQSAHRAFLKTWDIVGYDANDKEVVLFKTKNNQCLNGKYKEFESDFKQPFKTKKLRLEKFGANWSGTNFMRVYNIEFFSSDEKFRGKGVFEKLLEDAPGRNPHKASVYLTASNFDFRFFHAINPKRSICTLFDEGDPWLQVELTKGSVLLDGYRMIQLPRFPILAWNFDCSADGIHWETVHRGKIDKELESNMIIVSCAPNRAFRFFRIVNVMTTDENNGENVKLRLRHFDVFGLYTPSLQKDQESQDLEMKPLIDPNSIDSLALVHYNLVNSSSDNNITKNNVEAEPYVDQFSPRYYDFRIVETDIESEEDEEEEEEEEEEEDDEEEEDEEEEYMRN